MVWPEKQRRSLECLPLPTPACPSSLHAPPPRAVSLAERPPELGPPLYERLVAALLPHARLPADFVSWEESVEPDPDAFQRLR